MFWRNNGKIVTNSDGNLLRCSECPCKLDKGIKLYVDMWNRFEYTSYDQNKFTMDILYYRNNFPYKTRAYTTYLPQWVDTETFMTFYQNGTQSLTNFYWQGYNIDKEGNQKLKEDAQRQYLYKAWEHDESYWYFNFSIHGGLGGFEDRGRLFYGDEPIIADYDIWTVAMEKAIETTGGGAIFRTIFRTNSIKNPSFAYSCEEGYDWNLADFTLNQSFIPFEQDIAPYGVQTMQYSYKFNIFPIVETNWETAVHEGYCKWTVEVNARNE